MQRTDSSEAKIQIVETGKQPLLEIISGFYTTLVVNALSWSKAYALYPQPSFLYHKTYLLRSMSDYFGRLLAKYDERGWQSQDVLWPEDEASHGSMLVPRRVGDRFTWMISLDDKGIDRAEMPDSVLEYASWSLSKMKKDRGLEPHYDMPFYTTSASSFSALTLRYRYIFHSEPGGFWLFFLGPRLDRSSLMELCKIPLSARSQQIQDVMQGNPANIRKIECELVRCGIKLPSYDHMIPVWYAEWEKQKALKAK